MKIGLLGLLEDYNSRRGQGIQRYMYEVYLRMKQQANDVQIEQTGYQKVLPILGSGISFFLGNLFFDFGGYSLIHNMDQKPLLPLRKRNALVLTTAHDFQPLLAPKYNDTGLKEMIWYAVIGYGMRRCLKSDYILARSTLTRDDAIKLGYDGKKITIISDGVDERYFSPIKKVKNNVFTVGYIGAFRKRKNVDFAIRAFKEMDNGVVLKIYGKQEFEYGTLKKEAAGISNVQFVGFASEDKIVEIYDSFDAFVFPSVYEGFGIPIIEAQARGLPVIIYKDAKIPEEVRRYCFEAKDEKDMARIITDLKEKGYDEKLRKESIEYARSFTWDKEAKETLELYNKLVGSSSTKL